MNIRKRLFRLRNIDLRESMPIEAKDTLLQKFRHLDSADPSHIISPISKYSIAYNPLISQYNRCI